jgi:hypothetical protein
VPAPSSPQPRCWSLPLHGSLSPEGSRRDRCLSHLSRGVCYSRSA